MYSFDPVGSYEREVFRAGGSAASMLQPLLDNQVSYHRIFVCSCRMSKVNFSCSFDMENMLEFTWFVTVVISEQWGDGGGWNLCSRRDKNLKV